MRLPSPSSFGSFRIRYSRFDLFWAAVAPLIALSLRDAYSLNTKDTVQLAVLYCAVSFACCLVTFLAFRLRDGMSRYFSVHDALNVVKAVVASQLMTGIVVFAITRLEGIPRSTPIVHLLVLGAGLLAGRVFVLLFNPDRRVTTVPAYHALEHVIIIGSTELSALYIKFLGAYSAGRRRIVAVIDSDPKMLGHAIAGVPIIAPPQNLNAVIDEFAVHGIRTDRIIIGGGSDLLPKAALNDIRRICDERNLALDFVPDLLGLTEQPSVSLQPSAQAHAIIAATIGRRRPSVVLPRYFEFKRLIDFVAALLAIVLLSPLFVVTALVVLFDVGSPVLFWQQRIGLGASSILLHKFRTLQSPFDSLGNPVPEQQRMSRIGKLLRRLRLDELPQLFNVLVGDMSLIGPRPLLPNDQPSNTSLRLTVRPGITGWAQINGGNLITNEEKGALDEYYVRHASLWLDLYIAALTIWFLFTGEKRSEEAVVAARDAQTRLLFEQPVLRPRRFRDAVSGRARPVALRINDAPESLPGQAGSPLPRP